MKTYTRILLVAGVCLFGLWGTSSEANQPSGFDVAFAGLDASRCANPRTPGKFKIRATVSDGDAKTFRSDVLDPGVEVTLRVQDSGSFDKEVKLQNCEASGSGRIRCIGRDAVTGQRIKAFIREFRNGRFNEVYVLSARVKDLLPSETGGPSLTAPITVSLKHGDRTRTDRMAETSAAECRQKKNGCTLRCRAAN